MQLLSVWLDICCSATHVRPWLTFWLDGLFLYVSSSIREAWGYSGGEDKDQEKAWTIWAFLPVSATGSFALAIHMANHGVSSKVTNGENTEKHEKSVSLMIIIFYSPSVIFSTKFLFLLFLLNTFLQEKILIEIYSFNQYIY
jgi:hypothetical protein